MNTKYLWRLPLVLCFVVPIAFAQTPASPLPRPADTASAQAASGVHNKFAAEGTSLAATLQLLHDALNDNDTFSYVVVEQGKTVQEHWVEQTSNVRVDSASCSLSYHRKVTNEGTPISDFDMHLSFADIDAIGLSTSTSFAPVGSTETPGLTMVLATTAKGSNSPAFDSPNGDLADRVAKAMTHAIELCGGVRLSARTKGGSAGVSLAATLQFIQGKMNENSTTNYILFFNDASAGSTLQNRFSQEMTGVRVAPTSCSIFYHAKASRDGAVVVERDTRIPFAKLVDVVVEPAPQESSEENARAGHPNWIGTSSNPAVTTLLARRPDNVSNTMFFTDANVADRVAKAMTHAIELCGGGSKDPF